METKVKPILLYISQDVYKAFQKASITDWAKQLKQKTIKPFAPVTELYEKLLGADIVIYGNVLQKCNLGEGIVPDDIFQNFDDSCFWTRLLEYNEIAEIKKKCTLVNFEFKVPKSDPNRKRTTSGKYRKKPGKPRKPRNPKKSNGNKNSKGQGEPQGGR